MALKAVLESLDGVDEAQQTLYVEKDITDPVSKKTSKVFALDVSDVQDHPDVLGLKASRDKLLNEKKTLGKELDALKEKVGEMPEGFTTDEWERLKALEAEVEKQKNEDPEKKKAHEAEIQSVKKMHEQQLERMKKQMEQGFAERDEKIVTKDTRIKNMVVRDGLMRLLAENGVKKEALPFVQAKLEKSVSVIENETGDFIAVVKTDLEEEMPLDQFIPKWVQSDEAKLFVEQPKGGGATGGGSGRHMDKNPWSQAHWNVTEQGKVYREDSAKADRLAKAAGHKGALGAQLSAAK